MAKKKIYKYIADISKPYVLCHELDLREISKVGSYEIDELVNNDFSEPQEIDSRMHGYVISTSTSAAETKVRKELLID